MREALHGSQQGTSEWDSSASSTRLTCIYSARYTAFHYDLAILAPLTLDLVVEVSA